MTPVSFVSITRKTRVITILGILVILISATVAITHSPAHPNIRPALRTINVLFDLTKDEDAGNADWAIHGAYSAWADNLTELGYSVDQLTTNPITYGDANNPQDLSNYAVYIIPEPQDTFSTAESEAIREFVLNGGGLILISDHAGADRNDNGYDAVHIFNNYLNTAQYGITFDYNEISKAPISDINTQGCPGITDNVTSIGIWSGATITPGGNATGLVFYNSTAPVVVNSTYGKGRIVALGDSSPFDDGTPDSSNKNDTLYNGWNEYSDSQLGINMVNWAANNTGSSENSPRGLQSHTGKGPYVTYGAGEYLETFVNGKYVNGTIINAADGTQSAEFNIYKYGNVTRAVYNPDGNNFTVASYDYSPPTYHSIIMRFVEHNGTPGKFYTVSNDANKDIGLAYGDGKILIVWSNLTRQDIKGAFYNTQTSSLSPVFTLYSNSTAKYNVAVGYDATTAKFLVVWTSNYDVHGLFVDPNGTTSPGANFPITPNTNESMLSVAGGAGKFIVTYRNGTFNDAYGLYFYIVYENGTVESHTLNENSASYCGIADVRWTGSQFMITYSDKRTGSQNVFITFLSSSGVRSGNDTIVTDSTDSDESPSGYAGNSTMLIAWYDYTAKNVREEYYPPAAVPELSAILPLLILLLALFIGNKRRLHL